MFNEQAFFAWLNENIANAKGPYVELFKDTAQVHVLSSHTPPFRELVYEDMRSLVKRIRRVYTNYFVYFSERDHIIIEWGPRYANDADSLMVLYQQILDHGFKNVANSRAWITLLYEYIRYEPLLRIATVLEDPFVTRDLFFIHDLEIKSRIKFRNIVPLFKTKLPTDLIGRVRDCLG